jgi:5-methylcytosine-specific restriction enzyme subunit McrC
MTPTRALIELYEHQQIRRPSGPPSLEDEQLAERLSLGVDHPRLNIRWLANGQVEVAANAWVGVVRFTNLDVHVRPKYAGNTLALLKMLDFTRSTSGFRRLINDRTFEPEGVHLLEIIVNLLCEETEHLIRRGLLRRYRSHDDLLPVLRGRLDHRAQLLRRFGQLDQLHCRFDEHDTNHAEHQLLLTALDFARPIVESQELRRWLDRLIGEFSQVCTPISQPADFYRRQIVYDRSNDRYRTAHELSYLILDHIGLDDLFRTSGSLRARSFMIDMNQLFEKFVSKLFSESLQDSQFDVTTQKRFQASIVGTHSGIPYTTLKPDLVVRNLSDGSIVPVDLKYKLYDQSRISTADLYQVFTYAVAISKAGDLPSSAVIFPGRSTEVAAQLDVIASNGSSCGHITAISIDIESSLEGIVDNQLSKHLAANIRALISKLFRGMTGQVHLADTNQLTFAASRGD